MGERLVECRLERGQVVLSGPVSEVRSPVDAIEAAYLSTASAPGE